MGIKNGNAKVASTVDDATPERLPNINEAHLAGRLTGDPIFKAGQKGESAWMTVAVNRSRRNPAGEWTQETSFVPIVAWGKNAVTLKLVGKGSAVEVKGRIRTFKDGENKTRFEVQAESVEIRDLRTKRKDASPQGAGA